MERALLKIRPLAPLSLVTSSPGAFYRSATSPSDEMIYGMLENIRGWHYSENIRKEYLKYAKKMFKKNYKMTVELNSASGYTPIIKNFVTITKLLLHPYTVSFIDLWTQHLKHNDKRHFDGVRNYDYRFTREINTVENKESFLKKNYSHFPNYYQSPKKREFIIVQGEYGYEILVHDDFLTELIKCIENPFSLPYLGTSEGWVDVKIEKL